MLMDDKGLVKQESAVRQQRQSSDYVQAQALLPLSSNCKGADKISAMNGKPISGEIYWWLDPSGTYERAPLHCAGVNGNWYWPAAGLLISDLQMRKT